MTEALIAVALMLVLQGMWGWAGPRAVARWQTRLVPVPGPETRFAVWSREGERVGAIWRHHALMWLAYDRDEQLVGAFGIWPDAALHLRLLNLACQALREEAAKLIRNV